MRAVRLRSRRARRVGRMRRDRAGARAVPRPPRRRHLHGDRRAGRCAQVHRRAREARRRARRALPLWHPRRFARWPTATRSPACACSTPRTCREDARRRRATSRRSAATRRCCSRRSACPCNVYPAKGYSATIDVGEHRGAPTVSLTDLAWKIVMTRLGDRLRVAGTAELTGWNTRSQPPCAARRSRGARSSCFPTPAIARACSSGPACAPRRRRTCR